MKKASLAVACVLALIVTGFAQSTGQRRVGWANTVTELLSLTPSKEAYVYLTKGNLYATNLDGKILAYDPSSTATANNTNVWAPDSGIGRWLLISTLNGSGGGGGGAITLTVPDGFGVTGSPLTPPGTLGITSTLTNLAKGTGSGFSNAVASVDYVPPGPIGSSGLTMTGTNLLGRYSSGTGAIQTISVSNGLRFYASQLLGPLNPTDTYIPYRVTGSDSFGDSPWYVVLGTNVAIDSSIVFGPGTTNKLFRTNDFYLGYSSTEPNGYSLMNFFNESSSQYASVGKSPFGGLLSTTGSQFDIGIASRQLTFDTSTFVSSTSNTVSLGSQFVPFANGWFGGTIQSESGGVTNFTIGIPSGYSGTGTNFLSDDGTYKAVSGSGGTTINPTDGYVPYRTSSTTFGDSPWYRISNESLGFNGTNSFMSITNDNLWLNINPSGSGTNNLSIAGSSTALSLSSLTTGYDNIALGSDTLEFVTTGTGNIAIGKAAGYFITGDFTTSIGSSAGVLGASYSTSVGYGSNAGSDADVAIGYNAKTGTVASQNVSIGSGAWQSATTGGANVFVGFGSGKFSTEASSIVAIGSAAGISNIIGSDNVLIGTSAGATHTNIEHSVIIGSRAGTITDRAITNAVALGALVSPVANNTAQIGTNGVFVLYLNGDVGWFRGTGAPTSHASGLVTNAPVGSMYSRLDGGMNSSFYVVETSAGNWVAK